MFDICGDGPCALGMIVGSHGGGGEFAITGDIPLEGYKVGQARARHRAAASAKPEGIKESGERQIATREDSRVGGCRIAFVVDIPASK